MVTQHEKSSCCKRKVIRFGGRRRQCTLCKRTWRVWQRGRGRKPLRNDTQLLARYLDGYFVSIRREAKQRGIREDILRRRLKKSAQHFIATAPWGTFPVDGPLILLADGIVRRIAHQWWTVYVIAVKSPSCAYAVLLPPIVRAGREDYAGWHTTLNAIPLDIHKRVVAIVCDGHRGLTCYARQSGWKLQRCQAHIIFAISGRRSRSQWSRHRKEGQRLHRLAKIVLSTKRPETLQKAVTRIEAMGWDTTSPILRRIVSGFVNAADEYRTYLAYPELNIPLTNNAMESFLSQFQELCHRARGFSSVQALTQWITVFAKHKKYITCNGPRQPKKHH